MKTEIPLLQNVRVASPCPAAWSLMVEVDGDRVRFCDQCRMNVYNLSAMTELEAERLLRRHEGRLCVRYYRRRDGTILTQDCPVGRAAVQLLFWRCCAATAILSLIGIGMKLAPAAMAPEAIETHATAGAIFQSPEPPREEPKAKELLGAIARPQEPVQHERMGRIARKPESARVWSPEERGAATFGEGNADSLRKGDAEDAPSQPENGKPGELQ